MTMIVYLLGLLGSVSLLVVAGEHVYDYSYKHQFPSKTIAWLQWSIDKDQILFRLEVNTSGWIALGLSNNGAMKEADMIVAWVDKDNKPFLKDMYGIGNESPLLDISQDVVLLDAQENDGSTFFVASRPLLTCDYQDFDITDQTIKVLFAYNDEDPFNNEELSYHGPSARGVKSLLLLKGPKTHDAMTHKSEEVEKIWELKGTQVQLPTNTTTYWCSLIKLPDLEKPHHLIKFSPILTPGNENIVHHMVLHECLTSNDDKSFESYDTSIGHTCRSMDTPKVWKKCRGITVAWGIGGSDYEFPPNIGYYINPRSEKSPKYFLLEIHYNNEENKQGIVDNSGFTFYMTSRLRENNAAILSVGADVSGYLIIPPRRNQFTVSSHCSAQCLQEVLPAEGIHFISGILHTHLLGMKIKVRQFRKGTELPSILEDNNYDFNYQESRAVDPYRTVLPGDHLTVECTYNSQHLNESTIGGFGTHNEMCVAFMMYYPAIDLRVCMSRPRPVDISEAFSVKLGGYYRRPVIMETNSSLEEFLRGYNWSMPQVTKLESILQRGIQEVKCYETGKQYLTLKSNATTYPEIKKASLQTNTLLTCDPLIASTPSKAFLFGNTYGSVLIFPVAIATRLVYIHFF